jgi:starch synthase
VVTRRGAPVTAVHIAAEYYPLARTGGLAEAVANLTRFEARAGIPTAAILPLYRSVRRHAGELISVGEPFQVSFGVRTETVRLLTQRIQRPGVRLYFIEHEPSFDRPTLYGDVHGDFPDNHLRFGLFALAAVTALPRIATGPMLLHVHDWHAALALTHLHARFRDHPDYSQIATVLTVHNAGYQGHHLPSTMEELGLPWELFTWQQLEWYGQLNLLKAGLVFADAVTTVSPNHAQELRTPEGGFGLHEVFSWLGDRFVGILNGIDEEVWDPGSDEEIAAPFTSGDLSGKSRCKTALQQQFGLREGARQPVFGMAARLVTQKGLDIILEGAGLFGLDAQFVFIGAGEARFEHALRQLAAAMPDRVAVDTHFTDPLEHQLMAGADFLLMPCQYEPCGLTQMRAQRYGTAPVVRRVGGLADTVEDGVTGFVFDPYGVEPLLGAALRGLDCYSNPDEWNRMTRAAMSRDFSWERSVEEYVALYRQVIHDKL